MLLEVKDMCVSYNGTKAVNGISMNVSEKESIGIIGPNGSGKSTFLKGLIGIKQLDSGRVKLSGEDITTLSPRDRLRKSMVFLPQGLDVFPSLTVEDNLKLFMSESPNLNSSLEEAYSFYSPLGEKRKKTAGNLSGGERRLLALTKAFMVKPKLLFLDEPSAGLAPAMLEMVVNKINEIVKAGVTLIMVEQILAIARQLTTKFYVFNKGKIYKSFLGSEFENLKKFINEVFMGNVPYTQISNT